MFLISISPCSQCSRFIIVSDNSCAHEANVFGDGQMFDRREVRLSVSGGATGRGRRAGDSRAVRRRVDDRRARGRRENRDFPIRARAAAAERVPFVYFVFMLRVTYVLYRRDEVCSRPTRRPGVTCSTRENSARPSGTCTRKTRGGYDPYI